MTSTGQISEDQTDKTASSATQTCANSLTEEQAVNRQRNLLVNIYEISEDETVFKALMDIGGPPEGYSKAYFRAHPKPYIYKMIERETEEEVLAEVERQCSEAREGLLPFERLFVCPKCGKINDHERQWVKGEKPIPVRKDHMNSYSHRLTRGSFYPTEHIEHLKRFCQCGYTALMRTKDANNE